MHDVVIVYISHRLVASKSQEMNMRTNIRMHAHCTTTSVFRTLQQRSRVLGGGASVQSNMVAVPQHIV